MVTMHVMFFHIFQMPPKHKSDTVEGIEDSNPRPKRHRRMTEKGQQYEQELRGEGSDSDDEQQRHLVSYSSPASPTGSVLNGDDCEMADQDAGNQPPAVDATHRDASSVAGGSQAGSGTNTPFNFDPAAVQDWFKEATVMLAEMRKLKDDILQHISQPQQISQPHQRAAQKQVQQTQQTQSS